MSHAAGGVDAPPSQGQQHPGEQGQGDQAVSRKNRDALPWQNSDTARAGSHHERLHARLEGLGLG